MEILLQGFYRVFIHLFVVVCGFGDLSSSKSSAVLLGFFTMMIEQASQLSFLHYQYKCNQTLKAFSTFVQEKQRILN